MNRNRLIRQLRIAVARNDRAAVLMLNARLVYSVPWRPADEPQSIWTRRMGRAA